MAGRSISMKNRSRTRVGVYCAIVALAPAGRMDADTPKNPATQLPSNQQVIAFLLQSIDWYRYPYAERQMANDPADLLLLDNNQPTEAQIVRLSFEFAKADAALAARHGSRRDDPPTGANPGTSSDLARFITLQDQVDNASQRASVDSEVLKKKVATARGADRRTWQAALDEAQSRMELLQTASKTVRGLIVFAQSASAGQAHTGDLASAITDLAQTVPDLDNPSPSLARLPTPDGTSKGASSAHDGGIIGLWSEISVLKHRLRLIDHEIRLTDKLAVSAQDIREPTAHFINSAVGHRRSCRWISKKSCWHNTSRT